MSDRLLTIGELARRAGVAPSALRYWEDLGLLPAPARVLGQRRYPDSAAALVGLILLLRDVGFSLAEAKALVGSRAPARDAWRRLARRKLAELDEQIANARTARAALTHALRCPSDDIRECPTFTRVVAARLAGRPLADAHRHESRRTAEDASKPPGAATGTTRSKPSPGETKSVQTPRMSAGGRDDAIGGAGLVDSATEEHWTGEVRGGRRERVASAP
jgi:MerR family redox-sensitive transcriptional activator SoxR